MLRNVPHYITDGYYSLGKAYRQGCSHFAADLRAKIGSLVQTPPTGTDWAVTEKGYNSKAGNYLKVSTITEKGETLELTFAHLSSVDVNKGDTIASGDVVAKSGDTGNVTGPHLHISAKLNGKTVNPQSIDLGTPAHPVTPQPVVPTQPVRSSDAEVLDILFGSFASGDNSLPLINFGANY